MMMGEQVATRGDRLPVVLVVDWENLNYTLRHQYDRRLDAGLLAQWVANEVGQLWVAAAYGDFSWARAEVAGLRAAGIDPLDVAARAGGGRVLRDRADMQMVSELTEALTRYPVPCQVVLATSDLSLVATVTWWCARQAVPLTVVALKAGASERLAQTVAPGRLAFYDQEVAPMEALPSLSWEDLPASARDSFLRAAWERLAAGAATFAALTDCVDSDDRRHASQVVAAAKDARVLVRVGSQPATWALSDLASARAKGLSEPIAGRGWRLRLPSWLGRRAA